MGRPGDVITGAAILPLMEIDTTFRISVLEHRLLHTPLPHRFDGLDVGSPFAFRAFCAEGEIRFAVGT